MSRSLFARSEILFQRGTQYIVELLRNSLAICFANVHISPLCNSLSLLAILSMIALSATALTHAQDRDINPRFGLVNAWENATAAYDSSAGWEIVILRWDELQPGGPTDWSPSEELDEYLGSARAAGREVVGVLVGTPAWATTDNPGTGVPTGLYLPVNDGTNHWANFVKRAASYYGTRGISRWVIWKDPDIPSNLPEATWGGSIEEYYQLVKTAYIAAREASPGVIIHLGGVGRADPQWFARFLELALDDPTAPANDYYFDVASLHVYNSPDAVHSLMANHFFLMNQKGIPLKEVWLNETGASPAEDPDAYVEGVEFREDPNITQTEQAGFILKSFAMAFAANRGARVAVYRLRDDLPADDGRAYGMVREDGSARLAYNTYRLASREFGGFIFARRVDEQTAPLVDYVRLTHAAKVTHVAWAITQQDATLVIPARSAQARLLDMHGNEWIVEPEGGQYRVAVAAGDCDDPPMGCLFGGAPWLLVEENVPDATNDTPPPVSVEPGGTPPTPDPDALLTATALAQPSPTPTSTATPTPDVTATPTAEAATPTENVATPDAPTDPTPSVDLEAPSPTEPPPTPTAETVAEVPPGGDGGDAEVQDQPDDVIVVDPRDVQPGGLRGALPYILMGFGAVVIAVGAWYFISGRRFPVRPPLLLAAGPSVSGDVDEDVEVEEEDVTGENEDSDGEELFHHDTDSDVDDTPDEAEE